MLLSLSVCQTIEAPLRGGVSQTVFPRVEARLGNLRQVIETIPDNGLDLAEFESFMDWFYCRVFPSELSGCMAFYADEGPPLREMYPKRVLAAQEKHMLAFLDLCEALHHQNALEALGAFEEKEEA